MSRPTGGQLLNDRETFERYESHSRPTSTTFGAGQPRPGYHSDHSDQRQVSYEHAPQPEPRTSSHYKNGQIACEYRQAPQPGIRPISYSDHGQLACEYRQDPGNRPGQLACEYRQHPQFDDSRFDDRKPSPIITTYLPTPSNKPKIPLGAIVAIAIAVPILIIICLFGAVWLQELGVL